MNAQAMPKIHATEAAARPAFGTVLAGGEDGADGGDGGYGGTVATFFLPQPEPAITMPARRRIGITNVQLDFLMNQDLLL